jgi:RNA polymerase sigma factor (sigma-70 family)
MPETPVFTRCLRAVEQLSCEQRWLLTPHSARYYAQRLVDCRPDLGAIGDAQLRRIITNFHHDRHLVEALQHADRIEHALAWTEWARRTVWTLLAEYPDLHSIDATASDIDDLAQEALIDLWRGLGSFRFDSRFSVWARTIVSHRLARHVRGLQTHKRSPARAARSLEELQALGTEIADAKGIQPDQRLLLAEIGRIAREALARHPDRRLLQVFDLSVVEEETVRAIGVILQLSPARVHRLMQQAASLVREQLIEASWVEAGAAAD